MFTQYVGLLIMKFVIMLYILHQPSSEYNE